MASLYKHAAPVAALMVKGSEPAVRLIHMDDVELLASAALVDRSTNRTRRLQQIVQITVTDASRQVRRPYAFHVVPIPTQCLDGLHLGPGCARVSVGGVLTDD
jgi:hypothetical protein